MMSLAAKNPESEASDFLAAAIVRAAEGRRCIDGRYDATEAQGRLARPGGDLGYALGLLALSQRHEWGLSPQMAFELIYEAVRERGGFFFHTDAEHLIARNSETICGCGHVHTIAQAGVQADALAKELVKQLFEYAHFRSTIQEDVVEVTLEGSHQENGVIIVRGLDWTVNPKGAESNEMYFVYDRDRDKQFTKWLVAQLNPWLLPDLSASEFQQILDQQLVQTLKTFSQGKKVIELNLKDRDHPRAKSITSEELFTSWNRPMAA